MHLSKKTFVDKEREKQVQKIVYTILLVTIVPSVYITYSMIKTNFFETSVTKFITNEINFPNTFVVNHTQTEEPERILSISLIGKEISDETITILRQKMVLYGLADTKLNISQGFGKEKNQEDPNDLNNLVLQDFYKLNQEKAIQQEAELIRLKNKLNTYAAYDTLSGEITPEIKVLFPYVKNIALAKIVRNEIENPKRDTLTVVITSYHQNPPQEDEERFKTWLATRLKVQKLQLIKN